MFFNSKGIANFTKKDIESLQYSFQDLKLHKKYHQSNKDSVNFWRCKVVGPRKTSQLIGYLVDKTDYFFGSKIPIDNLHLSLIEENDNE
ncbi:conjugal transfer nickase/helicase domain-containing protein [Haemophilus influenzae]